ncbi:ABC transporter ATP-binding protein [Desulfobacula sp.]|uniref:ABC transporter ATP-binding protein n=1 Tax=Desulfobacula sp. TaxID=2593537 RepID=UPI00262D7FB0|nr:ABC transporter ATP-binding protein [Desulfobacula sp.]
MNLRINDLFVSYIDDNHVLSAVNGVGFKVEKGHITVLVGESGSGKTTIGLACMGLLPDNAEVGGQIWLGTQMLTALGHSSMNQLRHDTIAMVFQNGSANFNPVIRVMDQVAEPLVSRGTKKKAARKKAGSLLTRMGLAPRLHDRYAHQLSGGQIQRALMAMALILDPDILILDEPTASLDSVTKSFVKKIIKEEAASGKAILLITHDLGLARDLADKTLVLYFGQVMEETCENIMENPGHPYTHALVRSFPTLDATRDLGGIRGNAFYRYTHCHKKGHDTHNHIQTDTVHDDDHVPVFGCIFRPRCTQVIDQCSHAIEIVQKGTQKIRCARGGITRLVRFDGVSKTYGERTALAPLDLEISAGELFCLVGETGSGKTTLAMMASGGIKPDKGCIEFNREDIKKRAVSQITGVVYQSPMESVSHRLSVYDIVAEPLRIANTEKTQVNKMVLRALKRAQLSTAPDFLHRYPHELNMGAVQRVCIARAIVNEPLFLVADEPTSALDPSVQAKVLKMLLDLQTELGMTLLFITHNIGLAKKIGDRVGVMLSGHMLELGAAKAVFNSPCHPYTRLLLEDDPEDHPNLSGRQNETSTDPLCPFVSRCALADPLCFKKMPLKTAHGKGFVSCHRFDKPAEHFACGSIKGSRVAGEFA